MQRTASAGSNPIIMSALPIGISGEWQAPLPVRTWLNTLPPRCAMPIVSAVRTVPFEAVAITFEAKTVPCPPTPASKIFITVTIPLIGLKFSSSLFLPRLLRQKDTRKHSLCSQNRPHGRLRLLFRQMRLRGIQAR